MSHTRASRGHPCVHWLTVVRRRVRISTSRASRPGTTSDDQAENLVPSGAAVATLGSNNRNDNEVYLE
jgi:hypothetical protein